MRYIREHAVYGKEVTVAASSEEEAKLLTSKGDWWAWEAKEVSPGQWEVYVAKHEYCFALND